MIRRPLSMHRCAECGADASVTTICIIPEPTGQYYLCTACLKVIDDGWEELMAVIADNVRGES